MSKIILTVGISGSGKSTWAHEQWKENSVGIVVVNRDKIRELLFGYTEETVKDYYYRPDLNKLEKQVTKYEDTLIYEALCENKTVIVDATHLHKDYIKRFEYWNVSLEIKWFDVTLKEALIRDMGRVRQVGEDIISKQYNKYVSLRKEMETYSFSPKILKNDSAKPDCYVFDIDGCLADNCGERNPFDWSKVINDKPIKSIVKILDDLNNQNEWKIFTPIYICSGRDEVCAEDTKLWFSKYVDDSSHFKFMFRPKGDMRPDWIIKQEMAFEISKTNNISAWFDDRLQVTRHLRQLGLKVLNVEHNNF